MTTANTSRKIIVTGGSRGIGRHTVERLARQGHQVMIGDIADAEGEALAERLSRPEARVHYTHCNVTRMGDCENLVAAAVSHMGGLDGLVNNAGITIAKGTLELTEEDWDDAINLNLKSVWMCSKFAIPHLAEGQDPAIVNVSSTAGFVGFPGLAAYCAAKGGVVQFTKACALDCAPLGIRVNAVAPGHTRTPMGMGFVNAQEDPQQFEIEHVNKNHPLGRMAEPEEVAAAICFLLGPEASFITGSILSVDGGYVAK